MINLEPRQKLCLGVCLLLFSLPTVGQTVSKEDVLGAVRMSAALIECGYNEEGVKIGQAAANLLPRVGLNDKSDEVIEAFIRGKKSIQSREVTCADVVDHARKAGIVQ